MKTLRFWFDVISPYACLAFERLPQVLEGHGVEVRYQPVLFAGLLSHWGQKGPAEIGPKRDWTYRQVAWLAHRNGIVLDLPAQHPFNPLALLRLGLACAGDEPLATPSRWVCEQLMHHVWHGGADANDAERLRGLVGLLQPARDPGGDAVKAQLKAATAQAAALGVFGVPTVEVDGRFFWGLDGLELLQAYLAGNPWFDGADWDDAARLRPGVVRSP